MKPLTRLAGILGALGLIAMCAGAGAAVAQAPAGDQAATLSQDEIDDLCAPIALYPDVVLAQLLPASTYPLEIVEAARFAEKNKGLQGDAIQNAIKDKTWDPSVKALVPFPTVLKKMNDELTWTQNLGDAFLAQPDDVMDSIQSLRARAEASGALQDNKEQKIIQEQEVIKIEPADPQVIYVPQYNPTQVYTPTTTYVPTTTGSSGYSGGAMLATGLLSFAAGVAVGNNWWDDNDGGWDWDDHYVYTSGYGGSGWHGGKYWSDNEINIGEINVNRQGWQNGRPGWGGDQNWRPGDRPGKPGDRWQHNTEHRGNVNYKNRDVANRYQGGAVGKGGAGGARAPQTRPAMKSSDIQNRLQGSDRVARASSRPEARGYDRPQRDTNRAQRDSSFGSKGGAFGGYDRGSQVREASRRGQSSRGSSTFQQSSSFKRSGGGGGHQFGGGGGGRGGGGGHGGGGGGQRGGGGGHRGGGGGGGRHR